MEILKDKIFEESLMGILRYIARDGKNKAKKFNQDLGKSLLGISYPYMYRKSFFYENENIRDFVFKGYVIPYLVENDNLIVLLDIFKYRDKKILN